MVIFKDVIALRTIIAIVNADVVSNLVYGTVSGIVAPGDSNAAIVRLLL